MTVSHIFVYAQLSSKRQRVVTRVGVTLHYAASYAATAAAAKGRRPCRATSPLPPTTQFSCAVRRARKLRSGSLRRGLSAWLPEFATWQRFSEGLNLLTTKGTRHEIHRDRWQKIRLARRRKTPEAAACSVPESAPATLVRAQRRSSASHRANRSYPLSGAVPVFRRRVMIANDNRQPIWKRTVRCPLSFRQLLMISVVAGALMALVLR